jgi:hypothetical protein
MAAKFRHRLFRVPAIQAYPAACVRNHKTARSMAEDGRRIVTQAVRLSYDSNRLLLTRVRCMAIKSCVEPPHETC